LKNVIHQYLGQAIKNYRTKALKQRVRSYAFLFIPVLAIVLFTCAMGLILWTLNYQDKNQQQYTLYRESAFAKQRILLRFAANEDAILELSREISNSASKSQYPESFLKLSTKLIQDSPEILQLRWLDSRQNRIATLPNNPSYSKWSERTSIKSVLDTELNDIFSEAAESNKATYGKMLGFHPAENEASNTDRQYVFWHVTPIIQNGSVTGAIATLYSGKRILQHMVPSELNGLYRFALLDSGGKEMVRSNPKRTSSRSLEHSVTLDKTPIPLTLHVSTYPPPTNLTYRTLLWLVIGLSSFVLWSLWSVWKQTSKRYSIQKDLQTETNFRRAMEESITIGMRAHDMQGKITYVNPAFCEMTGWTRHELIGMSPPFPFWPSELVPELTQKMAVALKGNSPKAGFEAVLQKKSGVKINSRTFVSPLIDEKGEQSGWISSIVDISEPIKVRQELALAQERFTTVLESLDAAVSVISLQSGQLLFANRYYRETLGNTTQAHLDLAGHEIDPEDMGALDIDSVDGFAGLPASALTPTQSDFREIQINQTKLWYEVRRRYISWVDGHLAQLIIATDITLRKKAEDQNREQEEKLQFSSRLTTMGEMASSLAHELNQPLAAISNYCTGIANRLKSSQNIDIEKDILPAIEKATNQAHRAGTIIQRIRGFVKRSQPQSVMVNVATIVEDSVGLAEIEAQRYGVQISISFADNLPEVFLDPILIQQVLVNLLKNAIDAIKHISNKINSSKLIKLVVDIDDSVSPAMLRIRVMDQGPGIPEDALERLYEPFFSTKHDGMGMGLNICRSIIESHHGRLWAENNATQKDQPGPGCTFTILLPLDK
jgi:PAS domain S-box-containing protein